MRTATKKKKRFVASLALDGYRIAHNCAGVGGYPHPPTTSFNFTEFLNTNYYDAKLNGSKITAYTNQ